MSEQTAGLDEAAEAVAEPDSEETTVSEAEGEEQAAVDQETDNSEDDEQEQPESYVIDLGGSKLELSKDSNLADIAKTVEEFGKGFQADYTRKTQEHAERVKSFEFREKGLEKLATVNGEVLNVYAEASHLKAELEQLQNVDMNALWQSDPDQARRLSDMRSAKQTAFNQKLAELNRKEQELTHTQQQELSRRRDEGKAQIEKRIKGFSGKDLVDYAVKSGIPQADAGDWALHPAVTEAFWKAKLYDQMQAKAKQPAPAKQTAAPVTPMKATGKTSRPFDPVRDADKMPMDEWLKRENARLAKKRG